MAVVDLGRDSDELNDRDRIELKKSGGADITPSDTDTFSSPVDVWVGGAGNVAVTTALGNDVTFNGAAAGTVLPVRCIAVKSTGTTATNLVAVF